MLTFLKHLAFVELEVVFYRQTLVLRVRKGQRGVLSGHPASTQAGLRCPRAAKNEGLDGGDCVRIFKQNVFTLKCTNLKLQTDEL